MLKILLVLALFASRQHEVADVAVLVTAAMPPVVVVAFSPLTQHNCNRHWMTTHNPNNHQWLRHPPLGEHFLRLSLSTRKTEEEGDGQRRKVILLGGAGIASSTAATAFLSPPVFSSSSSSSVSRIKPAFAATTTLGGNNNNNNNNNKPIADLPMRRLRLPKDGMGREYVIIQLYIQGKGPYDFMVDSGLTTELVTPRE